MESFREYCCRKMRRIRFQAFEKGDWSAFSLCVSRTQNTEWSTLTQWNRAKMREKNHIARQTLRNSIQHLWSHGSIVHSRPDSHAIVIRLMSMWPNLMFKRALIVRLLYDIENISDWIIIAVVLFFYNFIVVRVSHTWSKMQKGEKKENHSTKTIAKI